MTSSAHNRKVNLLEAIKAIRVSDFVQQEVLLTVHKLYQSLDNDFAATSGRMDVDGLTSKEIAHVLNSESMSAVNSVRQRMGVTYAVAKKIVTTHPSYTTAKVTSVLEDKDENPF